MKVSYTLGSIERIRISNTRRLFEASAPPVAQLTRRDAYLRKVLAREIHFIRGTRKFLCKIAGELTELLANWAGATGVRVFLTGAILKGCTVRSSSVCDLLLLFPTNTSDLPEKFDKLVVALERAGLAPVVKGPVVGCTVLGRRVDLIPAARVLLGPESSLWVELANATTTSLAQQIFNVYSAERANEIRLTKVWRDQHGLEFPSPYLEAVVIKALDVYQVSNTLYGRLRQVLRFLATSFFDEEVEDFGNSYNLLSHTLTDSEKRAIQNAASDSLTFTRASDIIKWNIR